VIPGSRSNKQFHKHLLEDRQDLTLNQRTAEGVFDENEAKDIEMQTSQMSLHEVYVIHGANKNTSTKRRTSVALLYMPGNSVFRRDLKQSDSQTGVPVAFATTPIWLLKGQFSED
jgi:ectoine hydroxylase-related dioxygenase (phytanoyl-CoA dioxygenase family)